jgi:ligand-binding sensor domain-containing protein
MGRLTAVLLAGFFAVVASVPGVVAQTHPFRHYTPTSDIAPLPSAEVQKVYQDDLGYIWFAVYSSGLARYDGERLDLFDVDHGLRDLNVWELAQDKDGHLWVGSDAGLVVSEQPLDEYGVGELPVFTDSIGTLALAEGSITQNQLSSDPDGFVWAGVGRVNIIRYDIRDRSSVTTDTFSFDERHVFQSIQADLDQRLLLAGVSTSGRFVWQLDPASGRFSPIVQLEGEIPNYVRRNEAQDLLVGTRSGSIILASPSPDGYQLETIQQDLGGFVVGVLERSESELWVATEGGGLIRVFRDQQGKTIGAARIPGTLGEYVHQVMRDREGNFWLAQSGGVSKLPHNFDAYDGYSEATEPITLDADLVTAVLPPADGPCIWVGTLGGGITCITQVGRHETLNEELPTSRVNAMAMSQDGTLWLGTDSGIMALSKPGSRLSDVAYSGQLQVPRWTLSSTGRELAEGLSTAGEMIGALSSVLLRIQLFEELGKSIEAAGTFQVPTENGESAEVVWFAGLDQIALYVRGNWVILSEEDGLGPTEIFRSVEIDGSGRLWVGTLDDGLYRSTEPVALRDLTPDADDRSVKVRFEQVWTEDQGAPSNEIETIRYHDGLLWVGTAAGLAALDPDMATHGLVIDESNGLPASNATSMDISPVTGTMWVGTNHGLAEIDLENREVLRTITKSDGLINDEVCYYGSVRVGGEYLGQ